MDGACSTRGGDEKCMQNDGRKSEGKRPFERSRRRWQDIRMVLKEIECDGVDWIHLAQDKDP